MKQNEKKMIIILLVILIVALIIYFIAISEKNKEKTPNTNTNISTNNNMPAQENKTEEFVEELEDGTKINTSSKLKETKTVADLTVGNISFVYRNGKSQVIADVVNNSGSKTGVMEVTITLFDRNGKQLSKMNGLIGALEPGESTQLDMGTTADVSNAYDFTIIKK